MGLDARWEEDCDLSLWRQAMPVGLLGGYTNIDSCSLICALAGVLRDSYRGIPAQGSRTWRTSPRLEDQTHALICPVISLAFSKVDHFYYFVGSKSVSPEWEPGAVFQVTLRTHDVHVPDELLALWLCFPRLIPVRTACPFSFHVKAEYVWYYRTNLTLSVHLRSTRTLNGGQYEALVEQIESILHDPESAIAQIGDERRRRRLAASGRKVVAALETPRDTLRRIGYSVCAHDLLKGDNMSNSTHTQHLQLPLALVGVDTGIFAALAAEPGVSQIAQLAERTNVDKGLLSMLPIRTQYASDIDNLQRGCCGTTRLLM